ncbi:MAG: hypothetical protein QOC96_2539, partial [Acidobacteriota bacterium]|nr:hypothetical protein [Acidobacteriota bacterium]
MSILRPAHSRQHSQLCRSVFQFICSILSVIILAGSASITHAATLTVNAGGDLQAALNAAQPGDTILLAAGASFTGPFTLPAKNSAATDYITIRTSTPDSALPNASTRISPADSALLPKLLSPGNGMPALQTAAGAHHYRLIGLEIRTVDANSVVSDLIKLGDSSS